MTGTRSAVNRRHFLLSSGAAVAAVGAGWPLAALEGRTGPALVRPSRAAPDPVRAAVPAQALHEAPRAAVRRPAPFGLTTLDTTARISGSHGYRRIVQGPGWPLAVRTDLAPAGSGRDTRRTPLACFAQLTDLHLADVQSPLRTEFLRTRSLGSWRLQEALTVPGAVALIEQVNALKNGPHTGRPMAFAMSTGDNVDSNLTIELQWFLTVMSGGRITPNTGDPAHYEGTQDSGLRLFWQAESALRDVDKLRGMPYIPGYLEAAIRPVTSPGLAVPWFSTPGNHDALPGGCLAPEDPQLRDVAVGGLKLLTVSDADAAAYAKVLNTGDDPKSTVFKDILTRNAAKARTITPDPDRALFTPHEYLTAHLDPAHAGAGPAGHGYTQDNLNDDLLYYTFPIADGVVGISLDTTYRSGHFQGSVGSAQMDWLERTLASYSALSYDADGHVVRNAAADDALVLVFSHHHSPSMTRRRDAGRPEEDRHDGQDVIDLLSRFPNVVAWINGHSHVNKITPHRHAAAARSFWEVNTASHVDYPHHARVIELVDNHDGTLSLFTTLIESGAPYRTDLADLSQTGLASLYRELSYNAPGLPEAMSGGVRTSSAGTATDRNTELLVRRA
ncbi:metallophosphoesterase, PPA1498 family [Actinacidiphila rubida]|uniref:Metallophosphoesterase, PPA1498 family n=2 Tax=Actinacidiphila rubida TaxID=310780 RepID=A0A1H8HBV1_9ACTN|nr:TIGR03767 family metallophosphoesterase [Actinacidiphila rubida]SEN53307.1 metallophosphoesterase, PPA1498 family [Actinacidiphila rubida]